MKSVQRGNVIRKRRRKYEHQMFLRLLIIVLIPLVLGGIVSVSLYTRKADEQNELIIQGAYKDVYNHYEEIFRTVKEYYVSLMEREDVKWLEQTNEVPYQNLVRVWSAQNALQGGNLINSYIQGYSYLNMDKGWVLSNYGMYDFDEVSNAAEIEQFLEEQSEQNGSVYYLNRDGSESSEESTQRGRNVDLSGEMLVLKLSTNENSDNTLVVRLNFQRIRTGIGSELQNSTFQLGVFDRENQVLYTTDDNMMDVSSRYSDIGDRVIRVRDEENYEAIVSSRSANGFVYIVGYDQRKDTGMQFQILIIPAVVGIILMAALYMVYRSTQFLYRPIEGVMLSVQQLTGKSGEVVDEFSYIRTGVGELAESRAQLQEMVAHQESQLEELFFIRLIRSEAGRETIARTLEQLGITPRSCYRVAAIFPMVGEDSQMEQQLQQEVLGLEIVEKMSENQKKKMFLTPIVMSSEILMIFGGEEEEELAQRVSDCVDELEKFIRKKMGCYAGMGVSRVFHSLTHVRNAYNEALEALRNANIQKNSAVTFFDNVQAAEHVRNGYNITLEKELTEAVDNGDAELACTLANQFVDRLSEIGASGEEYQFYVERLVVAILCVPYNAGIAINELWRDEEKRQIFRELSHIYDGGQLKTWLRRTVIEPISLNITEFRKDSSHDIIRQIEKLVEKCGGDITLEECAQQLNYHPSYIWKVLKNERGLTFTDLVNRKKLERAMHMLEESSRTVADIAAELGYSNVQNFIRFFSKMTGTTPGKYRKEKRNL